MNTVNGQVDLGEKTSSRNGGGIIDGDLIRNESCLNIFIDGGACHQNLGSREKKGDELI